MTNLDDNTLSRRKWLGLTTGTLGAGLLTGMNAPAQSASTVTLAENTLGVRTYNIRDFGAKGDGVSLDTAALQAAIDACHRDHGGIVLVPAGTFHIGTVELKSNVTLYLAAASKLLGSSDGKQYHAVDEIPLHGDSTLEDGNVALI